MGKIYGLTKRLNIWLGPQDDISDRAMDFVDEFGKTLKPENSNEAAVNNQKLLSDYITGLTDDFAPFLAFRKLCDNEWFTRGWIVQELLLPLTEEILPDGRKSLMRTKKNLIYGEKKVDWILFSRVKTTVSVHPWSKKHLKNFPDRMPTGKKGIYLTRIPLARVQPEREPAAYQRQYTAIRDLVYEYRDQKVTDQRDKIYAFLRLANDAQTEEFKPDYSVEVPEAYTNFAKFLLTRNQPGDRPLKLLSACYRIPGFNNTLPMLSWVPDWTISSDKRPICVRECDKRRGRL